MSFKINYKGNTVVLPFEYKCLECGEHTTIDQTRRETMRDRECPNCETGILSRYIARPPSLDADYHEAHKTRNIGWD